jgi:hypothetical protein
MSAVIPDSTGPAVLKLTLPEHVVEEGPSSGSMGGCRVAPVIVS